MFSFRPRSSSLRRPAGSRLGISKVAFGLFVAGLVAATWCASAFAKTSGSSMPNKDSASQPQTGSRQLIQPQGTLVFEPNAGQDQSDANYIVRSESYLARLNRRSVSLVFSQAAKVDARNRRGTEKSDLTLEFRGALANVEPAGEQPLQGCIDYFPTGNPADWMTNIPTFRRVHYRSL